MTMTKENWIFVALIVALVLVCAMALTSCASKETEAALEEAKRTVAQLEAEAGELRSILELEPSEETRLELERVESELAVARSRKNDLLAKKAEEKAASRQEWFDLAGGVLGIFFAAMGIGGGARKTA